MSEPSGLRVPVVVPTLGKSPHLKAVIDAMLEDGDGRIRIVLVDQRERSETTALDVCASEHLEILRLEGNRGFAGGTNAGIEHALARQRAPFVVLLNDDAVVVSGFLDALLETAESQPDAAALQGTNVQAPGSERIDGTGIGWRRYRAIQVGHDLLEDTGFDAGEGSPTEVFGVSATAALYRTVALEKARLARSGAVFDERLGSYYEDVDLAVRLRALGFSAYTVPAARVRHFGSVTGKTLGTRRMRLLYRNRWWVLARALGKTFFWRAPAIFGSDLYSLAPVLFSSNRSDGGFGVARAAFLGSCAGLLGCAPFAHFGEPLVEAALLRGEPR